MVDVAFAIAGEALPTDHARALGEALLAALPWLAEVDGAGVHPVRLAPAGGERGWLSRRSRLTLRVPREHASSAASLAGARLEIEGHRILLAGAPVRRELQPYSTLYAARVAADGDDEMAFAAAIDAELAKLDIACRRICGRRSALADGRGMQPAFSLMLDGLGADDALCVLERGLGEHRLWGCGLFVPHRSAAAVVA
jgi:CRISPR-associated protein Cas6